MLFKSESNCFVKALEANKVFSKTEIGGIINRRITGDALLPNDGRLEIIIKPHNSMESGQDKRFIQKKEVLDRKPSFTYVGFYTIKPEMAKNLALFGRPFRKPRGNGRKSPVKGKTNKYWTSKIIPAWFQF